jgi:MFS family permease
MVVFPLLVRDFYGGDVTQLALLTATFPLGTIISSVAILLVGIRHKGWAQIGALIIGSVFLGVVGIGLPFWAALLGVLAWGMAGAVFMNAGRTLFQEHAPPAERGRVLSTYSLGFMGAGGLLGAPLAGFLVEAIGILPTLRLAAGSMAVTAALLALTTGITRAR